MLAAPHAGADPRRELVILAVGAALGLGALNEMVEFLATLAHHGSHAGGDLNTGWGLVCNFTRAAAAGLVIARSRGGPAWPAGKPARPPRGGLPSRWGVPPPCPPCF